MCALSALLAYSSNYAAVSTSLPLSAATGCGCANMHVHACASLLRDVNTSACAIRDHVIVDVYNCMRVCMVYVHSDMCMHVVGGCMLTQMSWSMQAYMFLCVQCACMFNNYCM